MLLRCLALRMGKRCPKNGCEVVNMTLHELAYEIDNIMSMDAMLDPEVYIQINGIQAPVNGICYFTEVDGVIDESVVIGNKKEPKLIL